MGREANTAYNLVVRTKDAVEAAISRLRPLSANAVEFYDTLVLLLDSSERLVSSELSNLTPIERQAAVYSRKGLTEKCKEVQDELHVLGQGMW